MERLTKRIFYEDGTVMFFQRGDTEEVNKLLADYEDTGYTPLAINALEVENERLQAIIKSERGTSRAIERKIEEENKRLKTYCESMREMIAEYCAMVEDGKIRDNGLYHKYVETLNTLLEV